MLVLSGGKKKSQTKQKGKQTKALISILPVSDQFFYIREKSRDGAPCNMPPGFMVHAQACCKTNHTIQTSTIQVFPVESRHKCFPLKGKRQRETI